MHGRFQILIQTLVGNRKRNFQLADIGMDRTVILHMALCKQGAKDGVH